MSERDAADERPGHVTESAPTAGVAGRRVATGTPSASEPIEDDTEGQGGKVFSLDQPDSEDAARR